MPDKAKFISSLKELCRLRFPYFFISLFLALHTIYLYYLSFSSELSSFSGRMLGICTIENFDASSRITFFYNSLFILLLVFYGFNAIINSLQLKNKLNDFEAIPLSWISALGSFGFVLFVTTETGLEITSLALYSLLPFIVLIILRQATGRFPEGLTDRADFFIWIFVIAAILTIITSFIFSATDNGLSLPFIPVLTAFTTIITSLLYILKLKSSNFSKLIYILKPLSWIPLLLFASAETALILNQRGMPFTGSVAIFIIAVAVVLFFIIKRFLLTKKTNEINPDLKGYFIWFLAGIMALILWQPVMASVNELFEIANPSNALMRIFSFKEIPMFQFLNSHLFAEIIPGFVYFILNGYDGSLAFINYNFVEFAAIVVITFLFLSKIINDYKTAFLFCLFIPFLPQLTDKAMFLSVITVFSLVSVYGKPSLKNSILFWIALLFAMFYSPDMAPATLIAIVFTAVFSPGFLKLFPPKKIVKSLIYVAVPVILIAAAILLITGIPIFANFHQALLYLTAGQSHGIIEIFADSSRSSISQYFVFPFIMLALLIYTVYKRKEISSKSIFLYTAMVFMMIFYFVNFQRGLLRHGFNEGHDGFVASFSFIVISLSPYLASNIKQIYQHCLFFLLAFFMVWNFGFPEPKDNKTVFESITETGAGKFHIASGQKKINRIACNDENIENNTKEIVSFFKTHLGTNQTFGDMSNSPALYYYSQKQIPSYFCQGIQNVVTDKQQKYMLKELQKADIPYFVSNNVPLNWFDATDSVPNYLRYYRISEYLFCNYRPWRIIGNHSVWIRENINEPPVNHPVDSIALIPQIYYLKHLPYIWAKFENNKNLKLIKTFSGTLLTVHNESHYTVFIDSTFASPHGNFVDIETSSNGNTEKEYILDFGCNWEIYGEFHFIIKNSQPSEKYRIRVSTQYKWYNSRVNFVRIRPASDGKTEITKINFYEAD